MKTIACRLCASLAAALLFSLLPGCGGVEVDQDGELPDSWEDAGLSIEDAGPEAPDAGAEEPDAGSGDPDAGSGEPDAGPGEADAGATVACAVGGAAGWCLDLSDCDGVSTPGYCPGPTNIQCCTPRPEGSCDPELQPQPNAGLAEAPGAATCPSGMVPVATFCIDQYEASLVELRAGGATAPWSPYFNPGTARVRAVSIAGAVPQGYVNASQAAAACAEAGKRLCSDAEWLRACQGPSGWTYPYGNTRQPGVCNDHRDQHPVVELFGTSASWIWSELDHPCINQLPVSLDPAGERGGCATAEGVFDMMGNLHEWTDDPDGTFRGGYYVDTVLNGFGCLYRTTAHNTAHWDYSTGFRCCAD